jgi:hypothetical protein
MVSGRPGVAGFPDTLRPVQYTVAPASPSMQAMPRPAPRVAPATRATFPRSDAIDTVSSASQSVRSQHYTTEAGTGSNLA